jgi:trimethylamine--corrinoid protein Co-methyltransferase
MIVSGTAQVLSNTEIEQISHTAFRILEEIGVSIPNERMLSFLAEHGVHSDLSQQRAFFSAHLLHHFLTASRKISGHSEINRVAFNQPFGNLEKANEASQQGLVFQAGAYPQYFADPRTNQVRPHTLSSVIDMTRLADDLENVHIVYDSMGVPSDVPDILMPLYMRLLVWKYTQKGGCGQVHLRELLPYVLEMSQVMADSHGKPLADYAYLTFQMISPLQFGREELEQFMFFWERGLNADPGQILSSGGTAPATLAGTLALQLAETLVINFLARVFFGRQTLYFGNSSTVIDLKSGVFQYGRPELGLTHLAFGQIARHYGASFHTNALLGDAKVPSCEMGMQKAINAIPAILAGSGSLGTLGLLSVDEIGSPIQLIIDNEYCGALQRFARGFTVDEEHLAYETIQEAGPGGNFMGREHTARHYTREHWQPRLFSREMLNGWMSGDQKADMQRALDIYESILAKPVKHYIDEAVEVQLVHVIEKARKKLC